MGFEDSKGNFVIGRNFSLELCVWVWFQFDDRGKEDEDEKRGSEKG